MTLKQQTQNVALDLKRTVNYRLSGDIKKSDYFYNEANNTYRNLKLKIPDHLKPFIIFDGNLEEILMTSTILERI